MIPARQESKVLLCLDNKGDAEMEGVKMNPVWDTEPYGALRTSRWAFESC